MGSGNFNTKKENLLGHVFHRWKVVEEAPNRGKSAMWKCQCACGAYKTIAASNLRSGQSKSCGCLRDEEANKRGKLRVGRLYTARKNRIGSVVGRLTILADSGKRRYGQRVYTCSCSCGTVKDITIGSLSSGTLSCGCILTEQVGPNSPNYKTSLTDNDRLRLRNIPEYRQWRNLIFARDNYTCICCGKIGGKLNAHHLEDYSSNPHMRTDPTNGVTVCATCHTSFHKIYGKVNTTYTWQFLEFLSPCRGGYA